MNQGTVKRPQQHRELLHHFLAWGVFAGGVIPVGLVMALNGLLSFGNIDMMFSDGAYKLFTVTTAIFVAFSAGAYFVQVLHPEYTGSATLFIAAVSWVGLNAFIFETGGPFGSVFAFHYLYIPTVVASGFFDRRTVRVTAALYFLSFIGMMALYWYYGAIFPQIGSRTIAYCASFASVFIIQLSLAVFLAQDGRERRTRAEALGVQATSESS